MPILTTKKKTQRENLTSRGNLAAFRNENMLPKIKSKAPIFPYNERKPPAIVIKRKKI